MPVTVTVYKGASTKGEPVATLESPVANGSWATAPVPAPLEPGEYTAVAVEQSSIENSPGESKPVTFEVVTGAPSVSLSKPATPSNDLTPDFSGTASESSTVTVEFQRDRAPKTKLPEVATVTATPTGSHCSIEAPCPWVSSRVSPALLSGKHIFTAVATQKGSDKLVGESAPASFTVDTLPPTVTLSAVAGVSNDATPSFSGTSSESEPVTVKVYRGSKAEGTAVASLVAQVRSGRWTTPTSSKLADGEYTALASEPSAIGNPQGVSATATFSIDTRPPTVTIEQVQTPTSIVRPTFSGTATDPDEMVVLCTSTAAPARKAPKSPLRKPRSPRGSGPQTFSRRSSKTANTPRWRPRKARSATAKASVRRCASR